MENYEKKYKEVLEKAKALYKASEPMSGCNVIIETLFPELAESEDEKIRKRLITDFGTIGKKEWGGLEVKDILAWLEKQGKQPSAIRWYDVSLIPQEMEELLVEWDSEDATWHEIAFYHADTKTFWNSTGQVENVTRWCYIIDLLEKQGEKKLTWSEEDEKIMNGLIDSLTRISLNTRTDSTSPNYTFYKEIDWLKSLRPQSRWKPSDGDIIILEKVIKGELEPKIFQATLQGILEQLKKL